MKTLHRSAAWCAAGAWALAASGCTRDPASASIRQPWVVPELGMEFVPVTMPMSTHVILVSRWETRRQDFARFTAAEHRDQTAWDTPEFTAAPSTPMHPMVKVTWHDANAFAAWLNRTAPPPSGWRYRLPSDAEWSAAVGLPWESGATPRAKSLGITNHYPWLPHDRQPPMIGMGNYADLAFHRAIPRDQWIQGYDDGFPFTAPVGSFPPNEFGLYDLGGNAWEWCADSLDATTTAQVVRGSSWGYWEPERQCSSYRRAYEPATRRNDLGFRLVLAPVVVPPATMEGHHASP